MLFQILAIPLTALLTSVLTLYLAQRHFEKRYRQELDERIERLLADLGEVVEVRVRQGVLDAVKSIPSSEVIQGATRTVTKTGTEILSGGLSALLGGSKTRRRGH